MKEKKRERERERKRERERERERKRHKKSQIPIVFPISSYYTPSDGLILRVWLVDNNNKEHL